MKNLFPVLILLFITLTSKSQNDTAYSFFVAGHVYGEPGVNNTGVHPPFKNKFSYIKSNSKIEFGVFTGDIVSPHPTKQDWVEIDENIDSLGLPVYFSVGNHDMENRSLYEERYGRTYKALSLNNDFFIFLDPNIDSWNISGNQLTFVDSCINAIPIETKNIFVFFHQVLWKEKNTDFSYIGNNSNSGRAEKINFWSTIAPKFHDLKNEIIFFAGDVGAPWASAATYDNIDNLTFITSGMGGNTKDNFLISHVMVDGSINYEIICLDENNPECIPNLKAKSKANILPLLTNDNKNVFHGLEVYPNPANDIINLKMKFNQPINVNIFNLNGQLLINCKNKSIDISKLTNGLYIVEIVNQNKIGRRFFEVIK